MCVFEAVLLKYESVMTIYLVTLKGKCEKLYNAHRGVQLVWFAFPQFTVVDGQNTHYDVVFTDFAQNTLSAFFERIFYSGKKACEWKNL